MGATPTDAAPNQAVVHNDEMRGAATLTEVVCLYCESPAERIHSDECPDNLVQCKTCGETWVIEEPVLALVTGCGCEGGELK